MTGAVLTIEQVEPRIHAFAAALGKGATLHRPSVSEAVRTGVVFGIVEAITLILGWLAVAAAAAWITQIDHWVAFAILGCIALRMAVNALRGSEDQSAPTQHPLSVLVMTAIATSPDALAIGITLAFVNVNILTAAVPIGLEDEFGWGETTARKCMQDAQALKSALGEDLRASQLTPRLSTRCRHRMFRDSFGSRRCSGQPRAAHRTRR